MKHVSIPILVIFMLVAVLPVCGQMPAVAQLGGNPVQVTDSIAAEMADSVGAAADDSLAVITLSYPQILLDMPNVHVEQDSLVTLLMEEKIAGVERGERECAGFRVQIYSSNHPQRGKAGALLLEQRVKQALTVPVYVIYASPSWKVRLGDFLTEQEAVAFRDSIKELFPDLADYTYIVRDQVKMR